jgi:hypothetical protein
MISSLFRAAAGSFPFSWPKKKQSSPCSSLLPRVKTQHFVDLFQLEPVKAYDFSLGSVNGRQYAAGLLLAVYLNDYPSFMISVIAAEFRIREVMRPRLEKDLNGMKAGLFFRFMRDFN